MERHNPSCYPEQYFVNADLTVTKDGLRAYCESCRFGTDCQRFDWFMRDFKATACGSSTLLISAGCHSKYEHLKERDLFEECEE